MRCPVLGQAIFRRIRNGMSGTDRGYAATGCTSCTPTPRPSATVLAICLQACYAVSGIGFAYDAICPRACYAVSASGISRGTNTLLRDDR
eukprot:3292309-Rhodomonas_salina.4